MTQAPTDTVAQIPLSGAGEEAGVVGFGIAEIAFLLSLGKGGAADKARETLKVGPELATEQFTAAGASSLLARGLVRVEGEAVVPNAAAEYLAYAFAAGQRWTEVGLFGAEKMEFALYFQAPGVSVLLQPSVLSTWFAVVKGPEASDADMLKQIIDANVLQQPEGAVYLGSATLSEERNFFVRRADGGNWDVAFVRSPGDQDRDPSVDTETLMAHLGTLTVLPDEAE